MHVLSELTALTANSWVRAFLENFMGAGTSKVSAKDSLYELLGVTPDADDTQLKKSYRKKALELHPDRNINNVEEATVKFANVQAAYAILTDPIEREWYDKRHATGKYDTYDANITSASDVRQATSEQLSKLPNLEYTTITAYFQKLKHEEQEAAFSQGIAMPSIVLDSPDFGNRSENWAQAKQFYDMWQTFATVKDFSWEDIYPLHNAQDRKTKRKFEQENKKIREAAKREYNAAIRQAVVLLKQNDVRKPPTQNQAANKQKQQQKQKQHQDKQRQDLQVLREGYVEQDWQKPEEENGDAGAAEAAELGENECIVCETSFETDFDLQDHKRSAKHKKALAAMKQQMLEDDMAAMSLNEPSKTEKPVGKAKAKAKKKKNAVHILTCGTCGLEMPGPELIAHKKETRHP